MKAGETKTATVTLPSDYADADLAGKSLVFELNVSALQHLDLPALDDEFAKDLEIESADALRQRVKENLESQAKDMSRQKLETAILDKILEKHSFEVPPALVDQVIDSMINEFQLRSDADRQAALRNKDLRDRLLPGARRRTQNTLVLWHVSQKENIAVTDEEVDAEVLEAVKSFGKLDANSLANVKANLSMRVRENLLFEKAMNVLVENAKVEETVKEL
jgi:trigger factor